MLNEKEASQLSDIEVKTMVIRNLNKLTQNYHKLQGNYNELTANYINMKKEIETINKGKEETHQKRKHQYIRTEEGEGGSGSHTNSTQDLYGNTTK